MNDRRFLLGVLVGLLGLLPSRLSALNPDQQSLLDSYKGPFTIYLNSLQDLGRALDSVKSDTDLVRAVDRFCDQANQFVDDFNSVKDRYRDSDVLQSMNNDPEAKKSVEDFMQDVKQKMESDRPIFEHLLKSLNKYPNSAEVRRVRDRASATFQRIQLLGV
jgi:hypothetical protein